MCDFLWCVVSQLSGCLQPAEGGECRWWWLTSLSVQCLKNVLVTFRQVNDHLLVCHQLRLAHKFSQKWQLRVCKWNFRMCKMPPFDENPHEDERIGVILGCAISSIARAKHECMGGWLLLWFGGWSRTGGWNVQKWPWCMKKWSPKASWSVTQGKWSQTQVLLWYQCMLPYH